MRLNDVTPDRLRRLSDLHPEHGRVLSLFVDLDPSRFADAGARATAFGSLRNEAERLVGAEEGLTHDEQRALREDLERVAEVLDPETVPADGVGSLAIYACGPAGLFEVLRLPESVEQHARVDDHPYVVPLVSVGTDERWAVLLVDKRHARILTGAPDSADEVRTIDDGTKGAHQKGGWSQARYQRSIDEEVSDHLRHVAEELFRMHERRPFDHLLVGGPVEALTEFEDRLHNDLRRLLRGRLDGLDVQSSTDEEVRSAAQEHVDRERDRVEREALQAVSEGVATDGAVVGLDPVLGVLNEARVGTVLLTSRADAAPETALCCPACGWAGTEEPVCPADGTDLERRPAVEVVVERALGQDAEILVLRDPDALTADDGVAALLRF